MRGRAGPLLAATRPGSAPRARLRRSRVASTGVCASSWSRRAPRGGARAAELPRDAPPSEDEDRPAADAECSPPRPDPAGAHERRGRGLRRQLVPLLGQRRRDLRRRFDQPLHLPPRMPIPSLDLDWRDAWIAPYGRSGRPARDSARQWRRRARGRPQPRPGRRGGDRARARERSSPLVAPLRPVRRHGVRARHRRTGGSIGSSTGSGRA